MIDPTIPLDEAERLRTLRALSILDTFAEERFDRYTRLAQRLFDVPIALVSLVDGHRQWFKSRQGLEATETPRNISFCGHAILSDDVLYVPNALDDTRFADNPLVTGDPNIRFYAGHPLRMPDGQRIGTLCLIDREARQFDDGDLDLLQDLAARVQIVTARIGQHEPAGRARDQAPSPRSRHQLRRMDRRRRRRGA